MKKLKLLLLPLLFILLLSWPAWAAAPIPPAPDENVYVHDFAGMLEADQARDIMAVGAALERAGGAEVVVVTVDSLGGYPIEEYANELFRSWGIGDRQKNNGVLLLVNKENVLAGRSGRVRIEVGYGLEGAIPDGKAGRILDEYVLPAWESGDYSTGIYQGYMAIAKLVADEYGLDLNKEEALAQLERYNVDSGGDGEGGFPVEILIFIIVLIIIVSMNNRGGGGRRRYFNNGPFWGGPFSGGGFGGGSFGGGGGFGGFGGGSSGGGGASR